MANLFRRLNGVATIDATANLPHTLFGAHRSLQKHTNFSFSDVFLTVFRRSLQNWCGMTKGLCIVFFSTRDA